MRGYLKTHGLLFKLQPKTTTVGRHKDSDLCLQNEGVEDHHALVELNDQEQCFVLRDLNSALGTFVNNCHIHNAAVRLAPGDLLNFGHCGPVYELVVDSTPQLSYPPVSQRVAWQSPLQWVEESGLANPTSQLPLLQSQVPVHNSWKRGGASGAPRPPTRARPASAGTKRTGLGPCMDPGVHSLRPGSFPGSLGGGHQRNGTASHSFQMLQHLLQEKEERILRLGDELSRVAVFESESRRKDSVIAGLRDEVSALRHQLTQSQADAETGHKLRSLEKDIGDKKEQMEKLKEQMSELQKGSCEVKHSLSERDLKIASLRGQVEKLKKENSVSTGLVTSLQRDLSTREKQALKLAAEVDKMRQDIRHKDAQLGAMSTKFSRMRETVKQQEENEKALLISNIKQLEQTLLETRAELNQQRTEQASLRCRLDEKCQKQTSLQAVLEASRQQLQESIQDGQKTQVELERSEARLEHLRSRIIQATYTAPGVGSSRDVVSDQQVIEQIAESTAERENLRTRVQELEEEQKKRAEEQERQAADVETFRGTLEEFQARLPGLHSAPALQKELTALQGECVPSALTWVQAAALSILGTQLEQLQEAGRALQEAGIEVSDSAKGIPDCIRTLWQQHQECQNQLQTLQAELRQSQAALVQSRAEQAREFQDQLNSMKESLEHQSEKLMEEAVRKEREKLNQSLSEALSHLEGLRNQNAELTQALEAQNKVEVRLTLQQEEIRKEWESARSAEAALRAGAEQERAEFEEKARRYSHTVTAMEQRLVRVLQRLRDGQRERDALRVQLRDMEKQLESAEAERPDQSMLEKSPEVVALEERVSVLRTELAEVQQEVLDQRNVITALSRDLAAASARMSDMKGELSERHKVKLEEHRALVVEQRVELSMLTHKLSQMSQLVDQKEADLQRVRQELSGRQYQEDLQKHQEAPEKLNIQEGHDVIQTSNHTKGVEDVSIDLTDLGSKCRGHRHEEVIHRQQEALTELRAMVKALEQTVPLMHAPDLCIQQVARMRRELNELRAQKAARGATAGSRPLLGALSEEALERTAKLDLFSTLDLSERTYLDLARAMCEALKVGEEQMSGCTSLKYLPRDEREKVGSHRQRDLNLLRAEAEHREEQIQQHQRDLQTLRDSQARGQKLKERLDTLRVELQTESQESSLLREALQRTQSRLEEEVGLNRAIKERKAVALDLLKKRSVKIVSHSCVQVKQHDKAATKTLQEKLKKKEYEVELLKKQLRKKDLDLKSTSS